MIPGVRRLLQSASVIQSLANDLTEVHSPDACSSARIQDTVELLVLACGTREQLSIKCQGHQMMLKIWRMSGPPQARCSHTTHPIAHFQTDKVSTNPCTGPHAQACVLPHRLVGHILS